MKIPYHLHPARHGAHPALSNSLYRGDYWQDSQFREGYKKLEEFGLCPISPMKEVSETRDVGVHHMPEYRSWTGDSW